MRIGMTLETFHCEVTLPDLKERLKIMESFVKMDVAVFLRMMLEIPSGPDAVLVL